MWHIVITAVHYISLIDFQLNTDLPSQFCVFLPYNHLALLKKKKQTNKEQNKQTNKQTNKHTQRFLKKMLRTRAKFPRPFLAKLYAQIIILLYVKTISGY